MECETCKYHSIKPFYHYFVPPFTKTWISLEFLLTTLYAYYGVYFMLVTTNCELIIYDKENGNQANLVISQNQTKYVKVSLDMIYTYRLVDTSSTYISLLKHLLGWITFCQHISRNMDLAGHTVKFWNSDCNSESLEIESRWYMDHHMGSLVVNLILGSDHQNGCIKGYRQDMKIPFSDPWSAHQIDHMICGMYLGR